MKLIESSATATVTALRRRRRLRAGGAHLDGRHSGRLRARLPQHEAVRYMTSAAWKVALSTYRPTEREPLEPLDEAVGQASDRSSPWPVALAAGVARCGEGGAIVRAWGPCMAAACNENEVRRVGGA